VSARRVAPYGSWSSPITAAFVAEAGVRLGQVETSDEAVLWLEGRPAEGGRNVIVRRAPDGSVGDLTPPGVNVRTRVHEYGGGAYLVHGDAVFFSRWDDQRLYRQGGAGAPEPITAEAVPSGSVRYADGRATPDGRLIVCVRESHERGEVRNEIVALPADGSAPASVLVSGGDFYSFPRPSPDGSRLAWTTWDHPAMPWDATELWTAELAPDGSLGDPIRVAGGPGESVVSPAWSPQGALHFVSDRGGWWNLYRVEQGRVEALAPMDAEFGAPQWVFGLSTFAFLPDGRIGCAYGCGAERRLGLIEPGAGTIEPLDLPYAPSALPHVQAAGGRLAFVGASPTRAPAVVMADPDTGEHRVLARSAREEPRPGHISVPRAIDFATEGGATAHALFYPPANEDWTGPEGAPPPPLVVMVHGGPTGPVEAELDLEILYFTSRGLAVVDVAYGGSTGYGRPYRERLRGQWGIVDTVDCVNAARHLAERGLADPQRLAIRGGSAGGWTVLCALAFHDVFGAGASHYGVADAERLAVDTHKFESHYLDGLIGPYPEQAELYRARSPLHSAERISCPVILFQGLEDEVVPVSQAEAMVDALGHQGVPHAYLAFQGEQHGFRRADTIRRVLEAELSFYGQVFGFEPGDPLEPVVIDARPEASR
jgi:dipeptidyl aminopeptidase/acylaminoacyl peptidase